MTSTKLNAEALAMKRFEGRMYPLERDGYAAAIREVAQPIADERDELLKALRMCYTQMRHHAREHAELLPTGKYNSADHEATHEADGFARRILAKYPKP